MRICRYDDNRLGLVEDDQVIDVTAVLAALPAATYPFPCYDLLVAELPRLRPMIVEAALSAPRKPITQVRLLSPVGNPGKIVAAPVNYRKHLDEARADPGINFTSQISEISKLGLFLKATSSVVGAGEGVVIRIPERRNDHEVELAVVIGKRADRLTREEALDVVAGYCIGLDMTVRGTEDKSFRKSLDTFTVLGPWLVTADEIADPDALELALSVNDEPRQASNTRDLIVGVRDLIVWASSMYTLMPGDVILTGTPEGVGPVVPGDIIRASVERIGRMDVAVRASGERQAGKMER